jgi:hypothetical protein
VRGRELPADLQGFSEGSGGVRLSGGLSYCRLSLRQFVRTDPYSPSGSSPDGARAMTIEINAWAGDNAGNVSRREPNRLLVTFAGELTYAHSSKFFSRSDLDGVPIFWNLRIACMTPGARSAFATDVKHPSGGAQAQAFSIEVAQVDWGWGDPWQPGVHIFEIAVSETDYVWVSAIATAVIDDNVLFVDRTAPEKQPPLMPLLPGPPPPLFGHIPPPGI